LMLCSLLPSLFLVVSTNIIQKFWTLKKSEVQFVSCSKFVFCLSLCNFSSGNVHCLTFFILLAIMIFSIHKLLDSCVWANSSIITHLYSVKLARLSTI
jgi:hypothetical protein